MMHTRVLEKSDKLNNTSATAHEGVLLNNYFHQQVNKNINLAVPLYLIASYAYYIEDDPVVSDDCYDWLAKLIKDNWETINHFHKKYLTEDQLSAGTYLGDYPSIVQGALHDLRNSNNL